MAIFLRGGANAESLLLLTSRGVSGRERVMEVITKPPKLRGSSEELKGEAVGGGGASL